MGCFGSVAYSLRVLVIPYNSNGVLILPAPEEIYQPTNIRLIVDWGHWPSWHMWRLPSTGRGTFKIRDPLFHAISAANHRVCVRHCVMVVV